MRRFLFLHQKTSKIFKNEILDEKHSSILNKITNLKDKIKEAKYEKVIKLNAEVYDDYYEDLREDVQKLFDTYKELKNDENVEEMYKPKMLEVQNEMDNFWNVLYNSKYEKFYKSEETTFNSIFGSESKFWGK
jgi:hypothetical protein